MDALMGYQADYGPFAASINCTDLTKGMDDYHLHAGEFFVVGERPDYHGKLRLKRELVCLQMICGQKENIEITEDIISLKRYRKQVIDLVNLVQPGFFRLKTMDMGDYSGIFKNGKLVAVTGERMQLDGFSEVSAVVTHPEYIGKGYAKQLVGHVTNKVLGEDKIAFLHVSASNQRAIRLYENAGYRVRREISFWNFH